MAMCVKSVLDPFTRGALANSLSVFALTPNKKPYICQETYIYHPNHMKMLHHLPRLFVSVALLCATSLAAQAQLFSDFFSDQTLRIDYTLAGNSEQQSIYFDELSSTPHWYGRRVNLSTVPFEGNGQIIITDAETDSVIYRNFFSTLFQEWIYYDEAREMSRSFEGVALVPMPKRPAKATIRLFNHHRKVVAESTRPVDPKDILIRQCGKMGVNPFEYIQRAKDTTNCVRVAFLAEGFTADQMPHFIDKVHEATEAIFSHPPFSDMRDRFEIVAVKSVSEESGVSRPGKGLWLNTLLGSHFDSFYSDRYLTTLHLRDIHDALAGTPYDNIIVLVNTPVYGGGGVLNFYTISSTDNEWFRPVIVHEFGHGFAGLTDEYAYEGDTPPMYPVDVEPWEPNITTLVDYESKWKDLEGQENSCGKVGVYEGAGYSLKGVYRPTPHCRMRDNQTPDFCPVCQRAIRQVIDFYTIQK